jgi:hypothetical protein
MSTYCRFLYMSKTTLCRIWLLVVPMKQGMGAIQQRKKPNGAKPFPPTRLGTALQAICLFGRRHVSLPIPMRVSC